MKQIVLISPLILGFDEKPYIPHSLLCLAAAVRNREDVSVHIVDYNIGQKVDPFLHNRDVLFYGITSLTGSQLCSARMIARKIRRNACGVPVVWGGIHAGLSPRETIVEDDVDVLVRGEGEETFNELITRFLGGEPLDGINGILFKRDHEILETGARKPVDMDTLSPLPYECLDLSRYKHDILWMISSRGCPHRCSFCVNSGISENWRAMSAEKTIEHLQRYLEVVRPDGVFFMDYNFFVDPKRVNRFAELMVEKDLQIPWMAQITGRDASRLDLSIIRLLKKSGCVSLVTGQDGAKSHMPRVRKPSTYEQILTAEEVFSQENLALTRNFIIGFPRETMNDLESVIRDIQEVRLKYGNAINLYVFCVWPGTTIVEEIKQTDYNLPTSLEEWSRLIPGDADALRFHRRAYRRYLKTVYFVVRTLYSMRVLPLLPAGADPGTKRRSRWYERLFLRVLTLSARIRWKFKFFHLGIEWWLLNFLVNRRYKQFREICEKEG